MISQAARIERQTELQTVQYLTLEQYLRQLYKMRILVAPIIYYIRSITLLHLSYPRKKMANSKKKNP